MLCFIPSFGYLQVYRSKSRLSLIVRVNVVLNRTAVVDNNRTVVVPLSLSFAFDYGEMSSPKRLGLIAFNSAFYPFKIIIISVLLLLLLLLLLSVYYYYYDYHYCYYLAINICHVKVWLSVCGRHDPYHSLIWSKNRKQETKQTTFMNEHTSHCLHVSRACSVSAWSPGR